MKLTLFIYTVVLRINGTPGKYDQNKCNLHHLSFWYFM